MRRSLLSGIFASILGGVAAAGSLEFKSMSEGANDAFGFSVAGIEDVNADGIPDLLVGGYQAQGGATSAGKVWMFSGADGSLLRQFQSPSPVSFGYFGTSVASVPDVTGDEIDDIVIGSNIHPDVDPSSGRAFIFNPVTGGLLRTLQSPSPEADGQFGYLVAGVPDTNGDGRGDVAVGARFEDGGATNAGRVYVYSGGTGSLLQVIQSPNAEENGNFGFRIRGLADVTGDGRGDLIVGALNETFGGKAKAGRAYVFNGATGGLSRTLVSPNSEIGGAFGVSVDGIPDLTGDGVVDLLVAARFEDAATVDSGRIYLFNGATGALVRAMQSPNQVQENVGVGWSIGVTPDVNADGKSDIIGSAVFEDGLAVRQGRVHVFSGATGTWLQSVDSPNPEVDGRFGFSVAGIPDTNNDGRGDLVVGAIFEDPGSSPADAGRAYLVHLDPATPTPSPTPTPTPLPPAIQYQPLSQRANIGQNIAFYVIARGEGTLTYQWKRNGLDAQGETDRVIRLPNIQFADNGTFQVAVSNEWGTTLSDIVTLTVHPDVKANSSQFDSTTAPATLFVNEGRWIGITMRNTSQLTWSTEQGYALGVIQDPSSLFLGVTRIQITYVEDIGGFSTKYQFKGFIQAPSTPGNYSVQLRMVQELVEFFGATVNIAIQVIPRPNAASDWAIYE